MNFLNLDHHELDFKIVSMLLQADRGNALIENTTPLPARPKKNSLIN